MTVPYRRSGLVIARGQPVLPDLVQALQRDLRALGYLRAGLDGRFGRETERAVRALQTDLLGNHGVGSDGAAPVAVASFNRGRVTAVTGQVDEACAACLDDLLGDPGVPQLPRSTDPGAANREALEAVRQLVGPGVPVPFLLAILQQESGLTHFRVPTAGDPDDFIVVGLDRNDRGNPDRITSRGYGIGQFTLFHHPPRPEEVAEVMLDPVRNVQRAVRELRGKFYDFILGSTSGTRADDRIAERGLIPLAPCRYSPNDPRFQRDCRQCVLGAPVVTLDATTPLYPGSADRLAPTPYHPEREYRGLPDRTAIGCDWPYAVRRYNGSGMNSYHYQAQVLSRLARNPRLAELLGP
jgi:peptidoglycan hydrolase-like protein with peptidoglycan-binding domain